MDADLTTIAQGLGSVGAAVAAAIYIARRVIPTLADARLKRAEAEKAEADAALARAEARKAEAEADAIEKSRTAGMLDAYEQRLRNAEQRAERAERGLTQMLRWAERVHYEMKRRGMTPPEFPAVMVGEGE